jgi:septum formation protein
MKIVLASTSEIRRELLGKAGLLADIAAPAVDEDRIKAELADERPEHIAMALARAKSLGLSKPPASGIVIGADQVLAFNGEILSKPADIAAAGRQLRTLRGQIHFLETAIACSQDGEVVWSHHDCAELTMRDFSDQFLDAYLASEGASVCTSVGGYKLEGRGIQLFSKIRGDYFSILGLPLIPLLNFVRSKGALAS